MEPFTVDASTLASRCAGSSAVSDPLIVLAVTPPVSPKASMRTRTSPFTNSTLTGPLAVTTSTSPLTAWTTRGPRAPATCTSPTVVVASRPALRGSRTVKSTATSLWRPPRIRMSWWPGPQSLSLPHVAQGHWKVVDYPGAHTAHGIVHEQPDREHRAEQRRPANNLFAPGVPERAHGPSLLRIGSILPGRTAVREVGFRLRAASRRRRVRVRGADAPLEAFRKPRGIWTDVLRYTARSAGSRRAPGWPRLVYSRSGTRPLQDRVPPRTTPRRAHRWQGSPRWRRSPFADWVPARTPRSGQRSRSRW